METRNELKKPSDYPSYTIRITEEQKKKRFIIFRMDISTKTQPNTQKKYLFTNFSIIYI